jgi:hypothetical protein
VPVDRENRDRAIASLDRASRNAASSKACIVMAPEGTRSKHGNLQEFKKGMFYMQEELNAPIVPFVIHGGFDLYPVGSWVNQCGRVAVQYLKPITSSDANNKMEMRRLCRRRILEALADTPKYIGEDLSLTDWLWCYNVNMINFYCVYKFCTSYKEWILSKWQLDTMHLIGVTTAGIFGITISLFVYFTYIVHMMDKGSKTKTKTK